MTPLTKLSDIALAIEAGECEQRKYAENDWESVERNSRGIDQYIFQYRRRPTMKVVEWTFYTCPRDGWLKFKIEDNRIHRIHGIGIAGLNIYQEFIEFDAVINECEYSANGIDGWRPCGTEVEE